MDNSLQTPKEQIYVNCPDRSPPCIPRKKPRRLFEEFRHGIPSPAPRPSDCSTPSIPTEYREETVESYLLDRPQADKVNILNN